MHELARTDARYIQSVCTAVLLQSVGWHAAVAPVAKAMTSDPSYVNNGVVASDMQVEGRGASEWTT